MDSFPLGMNPICPIMGNIPTFSSSGSAKNASDARTADPTTSAVSIPWRVKMANPQSSRDRTRADPNSVSSGSDGSDLRDRLIREASKTGTPALVLAPAEEEEALVLAPAATAEEEVVAEGMVDDDDDVLGWRANTAEVKKILSSDLFSCLWRSRQVMERNELLLLFIFLRQS